MTHVPPPTAPSSWHAHGLRSVSGEIAAFREHFPAWLDDTRPTYCLPDKVIEPLSGWKGYSSDAANREKAFGALCRNLGGVGLWANQVVCHRFVGTEAIRPHTRSEMQSVGWSLGQQRMVENAQKQVAISNLRLRGYLGWLVTDPGFAREKDQLQQCWSALAVEESVALPLRRPLQLPRQLPTFAVPQQARAASPAGASFFEQVESFLNRWGLVELTTWELPLPQGPLLPASLPPGSPALPTHGVHVVLPLHYPLADNDGLVGLIQKQQAEQARAQGLDGLAGLQHYESWAQMFEVDFFERAIRARFDADAAAGLVRQIELALASYLKLSTGHVARLRGGINACRNGRRESISWLPPRV